MRDSLMFTSTSNLSFQGLCSYFVWATSLERIQRKARSV